MSRLSPLLMKQLLLLSGALNVVCLAIFIYFICGDNIFYLPYHPKETAYLGPPPVSPAFLARFQAFPFEQLRELLQDTRKVSQGYRVRDFALGALFLYHDFDVERGVGKGELCRKKWTHLNSEFVLYPGLEESDFSALSTFASLEKFPYTPKGLYKQIAALGIDASPADLLVAFCHTPPFLLVETLFARTQPPLQRRALLSLVIEGGWENLAALETTEKAGADFSLYRRHQFILAALEKESKTAAHLLATAHLAFAVKELDDSQVAQVLTLLVTDKAAGKRLAHIISLSPRGDRVCSQARSFIGEADEAERDSPLAGHFIERPGNKTLLPCFRQRPPAVPPTYTHIVQPGESLWLISRKYGMTIESLMEYNHLQSTVIQTGHVLRIPPAVR